MTKYIRKSTIFKNKLTFDYLIKNNHIISKTVHPYFTFKKIGIYYLCAFDEYKSEILYFRLSRMSKLYVSSEKFEINQALHHRYQEIIFQNAGIYSKDDLILMKCKVKQASIYLFQDIFQIEMKAIKKTKEYSIFEIKIGRLSDIMHQLLSLGDGVEIVEPLALRDQMRDQIEKMSNLYVSS